MIRKEKYFCALENNKSPTFLVLAVEVSQLYEDILVKVI